MNRAVGVGSGNVGVARGEAPLSVVEPETRVHSMESEEEEEEVDENILEESDDENGEETAGSSVEEPDDYNSNVLLFLSLTVHFCHVN